ncbi:M24 family metallopeptidase [Corynebacterium heidelbergense]|uniref:Peptidase n=1 Tax=Corynebacterium heidelbergense TaxID=2055947 RepID=A0A364VBZ3_9CORY|nr:Xaa-Pro peptidase family protein [Corynebacterium heidelbergense]RAV34086.1 peptidase [Corynebacterium heidelbergense]WCZ36608.1 putative peptidase [Corynebacterium heidelbergense]
MAEVNANETAERGRQRRQRVGRHIADANHGALLITDLKNVRYLTGFTGSNAVLLLRPDGSCVLGTDGRYTTQVRQQTGAPEDMEILIERDLFAALREKGAFAVEPSLPVARAKALGDPPILSGTVERERLIKDDAEIDALRRAGHLADRVWTEFLAGGALRANRPEREAAADLEYRLRMAGADGLSFDTILASGANSAKPHAGASGDPLLYGLVTVDFGVYVDGYASDQTRCVSIEKPHALGAEIYDIVLRAHRAGAQLLAPGARLRDIHQACVDVIEDAGYGPFFVHSTGHGVGLDVHEAPSASGFVDPEETLQEGMTLTVEPGIYLPGRIGVRLENTYVITPTGAESLNPSSLDLHVV